MQKNNPKIIGITGGKGGTGKSTVAAALSYELAKKHKVWLIDADVDCPNDHLLLNIKRRLLKKVEQRIPRWNFKKCTMCGLCGTVCETNSIVSIKGNKPIFLPAQCNGCGACVIKCGEKAISWDKKEIGKIYTGSNYNISFLSGELEVNQPISEFVVNALNDIINKEKSKFDYIIVDTAAGTHCPVIAALKSCDIVFAIAEPTPLGGHDLDLILQLLKKLKIKSSIILNRSDIGNKQIIKFLASKHQAKITAEIPYSKKIFKQYIEGRPITIKNMELQKILRVIFASRPSVSFL